MAALGVAVYGLFCRLEGRQPTREVLYELALMRRDLRDLDAAAAVRERSDLIVGLTTIPSRLPSLLPTLKSLLLQNVPPSNILLHLPTHSRREKVEYSVPEELEGLEVISYPEYVQNDENGKSLLAYQEEEWGEHEDYTDKNLVNHIYPPVLDSYNHSGLTLRDTLIMHNWLAYAAAIGDSSYMEISGRPVEKLPIYKRPPFQATKE